MYRNQRSRYPLPKKENKMKGQWIDIMFGDRFHRKFKYRIDTMFKTWVADLVNYTLSKFPYLRKRKEFDLWFYLNNTRTPSQINVRPSK